MRVSVSNIAWTSSEEPAIARLLADQGVTLVDIAPTKYFPNPITATPAEVKALRKRWDTWGFAVQGIQSLLYGTTGLNLFSDPNGIMLRRVEAMCRIAGGLGAETVNFGALRQRDCSGLCDGQAHEIAQTFFQKVGDAAARAGVVFCIEPAAASSGCTYLVGTDAAAAAIDAVSHPSVRLLFDVGVAIEERERLVESIERHASRIAHVHASEPHLLPLRERRFHEATGAALRRFRPDVTVTVEMTTAPGRRAAADVRRATKLALACYGDDASL